LTSASFFNIIQIERPDPATYLAAWATEYQLTDPSARTRFLGQLSHLLLGNHPDEALLLHPVIKSSVLEHAGATHFVYLCFFREPSEKYSRFCRDLQDLLPPNIQLLGESLITTTRLAPPQSGQLDLLILAATPAKSKNATTTKQRHLQGCLFILPTCNYETYYKEYKRKRSLIFQ
jgi:hypothetical protein